MTNFLQAFSSFSPPNFLAIKNRLTAWLTTNTAPEGKSGEILQPVPEIPSAIDYSTEFYSTGLPWPTKYWAPSPAAGCKDFRLTTPLMWGNTGSGIKRLWSRASSMASSEGCCRNQMVTHPDLSHPQKWYFLVQTITISQRPFLTAVIARCYDPTLVCPSRCATKRAANTSPITCPFCWPACESSWQPPHAGQWWRHSLCVHPQAHVHKARTIRPFALDLC